MASALTCAGFFQSLSMSAVAVWPLIPAHRSAVQRHYHHPRDDPERKRGAPPHHTDTHTHTHNRHIDSHRNRGGWWGRGNIKVSMKRYVRWRGGVCVRSGHQVTGGRGGVCMCTGWHVCVVCIYYLSIAYPVYSCDVRPLYQEQRAGVIMAITGCIVQCSIAILQ